jgi:uroporphyrinogen-III synthase
MTALELQLRGRRILLTRSAEDCVEWAERLRARGAEALVLPCISTEPIDTRALRSALRAAAATADWLVLTSKRGAEAFASLHGEPFARTKIAVVGATTAEVARRLLGRADLVGAGTAAALATELAQRDVAGREILLALAENAGSVLEETLVAAGARCTRCNVYRTVPAPAAASRRALSSLGADNIVLASPTAVTGFVHQIAIDVPAEIYTIGPSTTAAARAHGLAVTAEAREPSLEGVVEVMQWRN